MDKPKDRGYRLKDAKFIDFDNKGKQFKIAAKKDVDVSNLNDKMKNLLFDIKQEMEVDDYGFDFVLTSGREGKHAKNSRHYIGGALDVRISDIYRGKPGSENEAYKDPAWIFFTSGKGKDILNKHKIRILDPYHGGAPHIHLEDKNAKRGHFHGDGHDHSGENLPDKPIDTETDVIFTPAPVSIETTFTYAANNLKEDLKKEKTQKESKTSTAKKLLQQKQKEKNFIEAVSRLQNIETPKPERFVAPPKLISTANVPGTPDLETLQPLNKIPDELIFKEGGEKSE